MSTATVLAEEIHPSLWRASQLARGRGRVVETGYPALSAELLLAHWSTCWCNKLVWVNCDCFGQRSALRKIGRLHLCSRRISLMGWG
jgi:hypothetical protein